jgi:endonuclease-3
MERFPPASDTDKTLSRIEQYRRRQKTRRVALILERTLGFPRRSSRLPDPLEMLIATILSQNTNDKNSHRAYTELRKRFPTWPSLARAPLRSVRSAIKSGGMANQKSMRIREILRSVKVRFGRFSLAALANDPNDKIMRELTSFHGVGTKTAACVMLFSLGRDVFPVDTHVFRICTRLGLAPGSRNPEETFLMMRPVIPRGKAHSLHTNMIRFGRKICRSSTPRCDICPLFHECLFKGKRRTGGTFTSRADHDFMLLDNV